MKKPFVDRIDSGAGTWEQNLWVSHIIEKEQDV
jgi:hypothetical protein